MKIGFWGNVGLNDAFNGQTIKNRVLLSSIQEKFGINIDIVDTANWKNKKIKTFSKTFLMFLRNDVVILGSSGNGVNFLAKYCVIFNLFVPKKLMMIYVAVGTGLPSTLEKNSKILHLLNRCEAVFCQGERQTQQLMILGVKNPVRLNNFREDDLIQPFTERINNEEEVKVCVLSRITKDKGVLDAIEAVRICNKKIGSNNILLDIYGPIDNDFKEDFENKLLETKGFCFYKFPVISNKTSEIMKNYFALLFPTFYPGEGVAGTIVDAFFAGIPIIASDWNLNKEVVVNESGFIVDVQQPSQVAEKLLFLYYNRTLHSKMALNSHLESQKYTTSRVLAPLFDMLERKKEEI